MRAIEFSITSPHLRLGLVQCISNDRYRVVNTCQNALTISLIPMARFELNRSCIVLEYSRTLIILSIGNGVMIRRRLV